MQFIKIMLYILYILHITLAGSNHYNKNHLKMKAVVQSRREKKPINNELCIQRPMLAFALYEFSVCS